MNRGKKKKKEKRKTLSHTLFVFPTSFGFFPQGKQKYNTRHDIVIKREREKKKKVK